MISDFTNRIFILIVLLFCFTNVIFAQHKISGIVTDVEGQGIPGVSIYEKGNESSGTLTNPDGTFNVQISDKEQSLTFSFIGLATVDVVPKEGVSLTVVMQEDAKWLNEVFVSATSKPIRKLEATGAIESFSARELERFNPTSSMDILRYTPGVLVQTNAGRARNSVFIRGFPDIGGIYSVMLHDGIRDFGSPGMSSDATFKSDLNVEKVEVMRGNTATIYGRGAAAGAFNFISKTGAAKFNGTVKGKVGNNNWYRLDANINGPLSKDKSWRYNAGGFLLTDDGYRNLPFPDKGGQFRINVDKLFKGEKGKLKLYAGLIDLRVNLYRGLPYAIEDLSQPIGDWKTTDAILQKGNAYEGQAFPVTYAGGQIATNEYEEWFPKNTFSQGYNFGANLNLDLGKGFYLTTKSRYQNMLFGSSIDVPNNNAASSGQNNVATFGDIQTRLIVGGGITGGGHDTYDFINDVRLNKRIETGKLTQNFRIGGYSSLFHTSISTDISLYTIDISDANTAVETMDITPFGDNIFSRSVRNSYVDENTFSAFLGDELKFGGKTTIDLGVWYDVVNFNLFENKDTEEELQRTLSHNGLSFTAGMNHLFTPLSAAYGNFSSSYRAPDYDSYIPLRAGPEPGTFDKPRINENEIVRSFEIGYRHTKDDWSFDGALFSSDITNRRLYDYDGSEAIEIKVGDNHIRGLELNFVWTPQSIKGLFLRTSLTAQTTWYSDFSQTIVYQDPENDTLNVREIINFEGNGLTDIPPLIWNLTLGYSSDKFGININNNLISARWADPYNTVKYPARSVLNANAYYKVLKNFTLSVGSTNLLNDTSAASATNVRNAAVPTLYVAQKQNYQGNFKHIAGNPLLPRRIFVSLEYKF